MDKNYRSTIETKYHIGDEVWYRENGAIGNGTILGIVLYDDDIEYEIYSGRVVRMPERKLSPTKEELLKSL